MELGGGGGGRSRKLARQREQHALHGNGNLVEIRSGLRLCRSLMPQEGEERIDITRTARSPLGNVYTMYMPTRPRAAPEMLRRPCCVAYGRLARAMLRGEATFCHSDTHACSAADGLCTVHGIARGWRLPDDREVDLPVDPHAAERFFSGFCAAFHAVCELADGGGSGALVCGGSCRCHAGTRHPPRCHGSEIIQLRVETMARDEMEECTLANVCDGLDGDLEFALADLTADPSEAPPAPPDPPTMPCPADVQPDSAARIERLLAESVHDARAAAPLQHELYALVHAHACGIMGFAGERSMQGGLPERWESVQARMLSAVIAGTGFGLTDAQRLRILSIASAQMLTRDALPAVGAMMRAVDAPGMEQIPPPATLHPAEINRWVQTIAQTIVDAKLTAANQQRRVSLRETETASSMEIMCINMDGLSVMRRLAGSAQQQPTLGTGSDARSRLEARTELLFDMFDRAPLISMAAVTQTRETVIGAKLIAGHVRSHGLNSVASHARGGVSEDGVRLIWDDRWRNLPINAGDDPGVDAQTALEDVVSDPELHNDAGLAAELRRLVSLSERGAAGEVLPGRILQARVCTRCDGVAMDVLVVYMPASSRADHEVAAAW